MKNTGNLLYIQVTFKFSWRHCISLLSTFLQNISHLVRGSTQILAEYEELKERLPSLEAGADAAIFHALDLSGQVHSLTQ